MSIYTTLFEVHDDLVHMLDFAFSPYPDLANALQEAIEVCSHQCEDEDEEADL